MSVIGHGLLGAALLACPALARAEQAPLVASPVAPLRIYMRSDRAPLTFSARERASHDTPKWCIAPCDTQLPPGDYQLKLNGVTTDGGNLALRAPGTLHGEYHSLEAARSAGWLALNVAGIIGGVFLTVGALGGPTWAYLAGGGSLAAGGIVFLVSYRADRATVSFTPGEPLDVRGLSAPAPAATGASGAALGLPDRATFGSQARGLGFRISF
jgi:hypothetical protein